MIQISEAQIHSMRQQISRQVAFPEELSSEFDEEQANAFLQDVINCETDEELQEFITLIPRRRLNDLFGALLVMSAAAGEKVVLRLLSILKARVTPSLAETGWAFYQHHYPNDRMSRVLSTLVQVMGDKTSGTPYLHAVAQVSDLPVIDENLPEKLADRLLQKPDEPLCDYFVMMMIMPDSPFAAALLASYFKKCPSNSYLLNADLFIHALKKNPESEQVFLISCYLSEHRLKPEWEPVNQALLDLFGTPRPRQQQKLASILGHSSDSRLWDHVDLIVVDRYRQWYMISKLNKNIGDNRRKKIFYQKYQMLIQDITEWDAKTLAIHFNGFVIADSRDDEDRAYYYDLNTFHILSEGSHAKAPLNNPASKCITARQAVLSGEKLNVVCLQFDQVNLLYASDFISGILNPVKEPDLLK